MPHIVTLFDKSFLQSLSIDESVWFDHFFLANISPLFFVETLADLEKKVRPERTSEDEVRIIADKFPEAHGMPNYHHKTLCFGNLMGNSIPMNGQIIVGGGYGVESNGKTGAIVPQTEEAAAFIHWRRKEFNEIERLYAKKWRQELSNPELNIIKKQLHIFGINLRACKSFKDAKLISEHIVSARDKSIPRLTLACQILGIPNTEFVKIINKWTSEGYPPLTDFAPYAAYVLSVDLFYRIALVANLISATRPSNRADIAYLYYLPFCETFVSSDYLHRKCVSFFLRPNQDFIWGPDLKAGLSQLNVHYSKLPKEIRDKGLYEIAPFPPKDGDFIVSHLWDHRFPGWREKKYTKPPCSEIDEELKKIIEKPSSLPQKPNIKPDDIIFIKTTHKTRIKKGSWYQVPKDIEKENP